MSHKHIPQSNYLTNIIETKGADGWRSLFVAYDDTAEELASLFDQRQTAPVFLSQKARDFFLALNIEAIVHRAGAVERYTLVSPERYRMVSSPDVMVRSNTPIGNLDYIKIIDAGGELTEPFRAEMLIDATDR